MKATSLIAVLAALAVSGTVFAQDNNKQETIDDSGIAPQALDTALEEFAERSGLQVIYLADVAKGKTSPGAEPDLSDQATLDQLLASTDLDYEFLNDNTVTLQATDERGASDSKNLDSPTPVLMAQNQTSPTQTTSSSQSSESGTSIVTGKVRDARTGANLKGAKITIEETGQWTATDDLGEFRLVNVPTGSATLTVSYLGYAGQASVVDVRGDGTSQSFALRGGSEIEEIVVYGSRSARAQALNQERTADNTSTVISSDLLGNFSGATISDALRRAPGVAFQQDNQTGDGSNVIVRGLEPGLNSVQLNGVELPVNDGQTRAPDLQNILADSIEKVTINKTLLPSQDSAGTGGLIEIETKSPLDREDRYFRASFENTIGGLGFADELQASTIVSGVFGSQRNFGLSATVGYRKRDNSRTGVSYSHVFGEYLPLGPGGLPTISSQDFINPTTPFPFEADADGAFFTDAAYQNSQSTTENLSFTLAGEWQISNHTNIDVTYQRFENNIDTFSSGATVSNFLSYSQQPVVALAGQERFALRPSSRINYRQSYNLSASDLTTDVLSVRGNTTTGKWRIGYLAGYTKGSSSNEIDRLGLTGVRPGFDTFLLDTATDETEGRVISIFPQASGGNITLPLFTDDGFAFYGDPANLLLNSSAGSREISTGENERLTAEFSLRREFAESWMESVEVGFQSEDSDFRVVGTPVGITYRRASSGIAASDLGISFDQPVLDSIGFGGSQFAVASGGSIEDILRDLDSFTSGTNPLLTQTVTNFAELDQFFGQPRTNEIELSAYLEAKASIGKVDIIGGFRFSRFDIGAISVLSPTLILPDFSFDTDYGFANRRLVERTAKQDRFLPRLLVNYRHSDNLIARIGYYRTIARPAVSAIGQDRNYLINLLPFNGPNGDQPAIQINQGNPNLRPAVTDNFDLSLELYDRNAGVLKIGGFLKRIKNPLRTVTDVLNEIPSDLEIAPSPNIPDSFDGFFITTNTPENSRFDGIIWGVEASIEKQLSSLPGVAAGLGVFANATYTEGSIDEEVAWNASPTFDAMGNILSTSQEIVVAEDNPFFQQPKWTGSAGVTYNKFGIDAIVSYTFQDRRLSSGFQPFSLNRFAGSLDTLNFRAEYELPLGETTSRIFLEGSDLLRGTSDAASEDKIERGEGRVPVISSATYFGGRSLKAGVIIVF